MLRRRRTGRPSRRSGASVALAGAGYVAVVHALAARSAGMPVRAVASAGGRSARHLAGELDARRCRPEDLPAGADVLVVATPPEHHEQLALQGLAAGAAVLVEKPLTTTLASADRIVAAAATSPGRLHCAENLLHSPIWRESSTRRPALGVLGHVSLRTVQPAPDWGHFAGPLHAGGALFDLGPHAAALALGLADEAPVGVSATLDSSRADGADDHAEVQIRFVSGLVATLTVSWLADEVHWDAQAAGDAGVLRLELLPELGLEADGEPVALASRHTVPDPRIEQFGYVDQLLDLVAADPVGQTAPEARAVLEVICAAYASAGNGGTETPLPFGGDRAVTPMELWRG